MLKKVLLAFLLVVITILSLLYRKLSIEGYSPVPCTSVFSFSLDDICRDFFPDMCPPGVTLGMILTQVLTQQAEKVNVLNLGLEMSGFKLMNLQIPQHDRDGVLVTNTKVLVPVIQGTLFPCQANGLCCGTVFNGKTIQKTCIVFNVDITLLNDVATINYVFLNKNQSQTIRESRLRLVASVLYELDCDQSKFSLSDMIIDSQSSWTCCGYPNVLPDVNTMEKLIITIYQSSLKDRFLSLCKNMILSSSFTEFSVNSEYLQILC